MTDNPEVIALVTDSVALGGLRVLAAYKMRAGDMVEEGLWAVCV